MLATDHAIAFDFDGTLVDSAPGILRGIALALEKNRLTPAVALDRALIGPPLAATMARVAGNDDPGLLNTLVGDFTTFYDAHACFDSPAFSGVGATLAALFRRGRALYLVTNKRGTPTRMMLGHLGWNALFTAVYCLDEHADCPGKSALLARVIQTHKLPAPETPYVGDTNGDAMAASANAMPYIHVAWGYGGVPEPRPTRILMDPRELLSL